MMLGLFYAFYFLIFRRRGLLFYCELDSFDSIQFILYFKLYRFIVLYPTEVVDELLGGGFWFARKFTH